MYVRQLKSFRGSVIDKVIEDANHFLAENVDSEVFSFAPIYNSGLNYYVLVVKYWEKIEPSEPSPALVYDSDPRTP